MIEADIRLKDNQIVMAHDASDLASSDMILQDWLKNVGHIDNLEKSKSL